MNRITLLGAAGAVVGLAGCSGPIDPGPGGFTQVDRLYTRSMAMRTNAGGEATGVVDRSGGEQTMTVSQAGGGSGRRASVSVSGPMVNGTTVPGDDGLPVDPASLVDYIPTFESNDSFLGSMDEGAYQSIVKYETDLGDRRFVSYGVTKGGETSNMPSSGTATYNGRVYGTVYGSQTGQQDLSGRVSLGANFGTGTRTIGGRMTELRLQQGPDSFGLGSDIVVNAAPISGNTYGKPNTSLNLVHPGTNTPSATMASSNLDGAFYGNGAAETAGTFQFNALGAPISTGGTENLQGVGAFGARR